MLLPLGFGSIAAQTISPPLPGNISTFAGTGAWAYSGDHGPASAATLRVPFDVATDSAGNLFVADSLNQVIRRVDAVTRTITTVAGNGQAGFSGDGGLATSASFSNPTGIAVDSAGNLYIADSDNNRVRRVDHQTGMITTVAGSGVICPSSYFSYCSGDGGAATSATLNGPAAVAVDTAGNLYVSDSGNNAIRRVDASSGVMTTVAGGPSKSILNTPAGMALDRSGNLYVADSQNNEIRKLVLSSSAISTVAGTGVAGFSGDTGLATSAKLAGPYGVRVDAAGNVYIADFGNNRIRFVNATTGIIATLAGNGVAGYSGDGGNALTASLNGPSSVALDAQNNLYIADSTNNVVRFVSMAPGPIVASPSNLTFGPQSVNTSGAAKTVTFTNSGSASMAVSSISLSSLDFTTQQSNCGQMLAPQASCSLSVLFSPQTGHTGSLSASLIYGDSVGDAPQIVALSGTGTSGQATIAPTVLSFGSVGANSPTLSAAITITNTATGSPLLLYGSAISSGSSSGFAISSTGNTCTGQLLTNASCQMVVQFSPGASTGTQTATLNLSTSASVTPQSVPLTATVGVAQVALNTGSLNFGSQSINTAGNTAGAVQTVTVSNTGSARLSISGVALSGPNAGDFSLVNLCGSSLAPGASCNVSIGFAPSAVGLRTATLTITDLGPGVYQQVALAGTGAGVPQAAVNTNSVSFTYQNLGTVSAAQIVTLANPGSAPLAMGSLAITGANSSDFSETSNCGTSLAAGGSCSVSVTFTPSADGARSAVLTINNAVAAQTVALSGTGSGNYSVPGCTVLSFVAGPNPIYTNNPFGITSINANVTCPYEVRINAPNGALFATGNGYSSTLTGNWVTSGLRFFLQQSGNTSSSGTLANLTVQVKTGQGCIATAFTASPNPIVTNNPFGQTTITADTNCSFDVHIGAPNGPMFQQGRGYSVMKTGTWVQNQMNMYLQPHGDMDPADTLSVLTLVVQPAVAGCTVNTFSAVNNPIITTTRLNTDTIQADATCPYDIRIGGPGGSLLGSGQGAMTSQTGNWVVNGLSFFLQLRGDTTSAGTLSTFTINTKLPDQTLPSCTIAKFSANPNPISVSGGSTAVSVNANCAWDLRLNDSAGQLLTSGNGAANATASPVSDGTLLYLQPQGDTNWQHNLAILKISAAPQPGACTALVFSSTPIVADSSFGVTNITADATCPYDIRVDSPNGTLFGSGQGLTSANTGNWVLFGQVFYLQKQGDTTPAGTLATNAAIIVP